MKCLSCGVEKDPNILETYAWEDDCLTTEETISPLIGELDCQSNDGKIWKKVIVCHQCFHKLQPDMWINEEMWSALNPVIPFDKLPEGKFCEKCGASMFFDDKNKNCSTCIGETNRRK